ncbi:uncharacterized protein LOC122860873 [Aphidius gifuensis]|uniref:uncharacterized protein LOC122860873 n=1 Tax=Aphidius gifuensis TaxID=684658 RepID=UPI001CDBE418|nr:uncharacterized protein LOC122860873 [Aphidius gifuensis]
MDKPSLRGIPKINVSFFCCLNQKTASLIIGCLTFLSTLISIIHITVEIHRIPDGDLLAELKWFIPICIVLYCSSFGALYICYLLIRGILQDEPKHMLPWIYTSFASLIMTFIFMTFIIVLITFARVKQATSIDFIIFCTILFILILGFLGYLWAIVVTYCRKLILSQQNNTPQHRRLLN